MTKYNKLFRNIVVGKSELKQIMLWSFNNFGRIKACFLANELKDLGFYYSTKAGISISLEDLHVPPIKKTFIQVGNQNTEETSFKTTRGEITEVERLQKIIKIWGSISESLKTRVMGFFRETDPLNSVFMMAFSGARGNISQVRQLVGMRGLMADSYGRIIDLPIQNNFREGLTVTDYLISSYGARKGIVDTALRTADSGYLTRRLIDVAQDILTREIDCQTKKGVILSQFEENDEFSLSFEEKILGRLLASSIKHPITGKLIAEFNQEIDLNLIRQIKTLQIIEIAIRSPLTCNSSRGICQKCYGWDLSVRNIIELGEAVGIIAAQSIGEPGTQLTMRTFHTGGVFNLEPSRQVCAELAGQVRFNTEFKMGKIRTTNGDFVSVTQQPGTISIVDYKNRSYVVHVPSKTEILVNDDTYIRKGEIIFELKSKTAFINEEENIRYIQTSHSGEIFTQSLIFNSSYHLVLWVLAGTSYDIPIKSKLKLKPSSKVCKNKSLTYNTLANLIPGFICQVINPIENILEGFQISQELHFPKKSKFYLENEEVFQQVKSLRNLKFYLEKNIKGTNEIKGYGINNNQLLLDFFIPQNFLNSNGFPIGYLENSKYTIKTGGMITYLSYMSIETSCSIFYIPQATYTINSDAKNLKVKSGELIDSNTEIFSGQFTNFGGIVEVIKANKKLIKEITIKPGEKIKLTGKKNINKYHEQIYYPGELLFDDYKIKRLSYIEVIKVKKTSFILVRPITRYEIMELQNKNMNFVFGTDLPLKIEPIQLNQKLRDFITTDQSTVLFNRPLTLLRTLEKISPTVYFELDNTNNGYIDLVAHEEFDYETVDKETLLIQDYVPTEIKKINKALKILVEENQFIEPYTSLLAFNVLSSKTGKINVIKDQFIDNKRKILIIHDHDYKKIYLEKKSNKISINKFLKAGNKITKNIKVKNSGIITHYSGSKILIRPGTAYLFSEGAKITKKSGLFVAEQEELGKISYKRAKTSDIVQGLPRVEEILEARQPKNMSTISIVPRIVRKLEYTNAGILVWLHKPFKTSYSRDEFEKKEYYSIKKLEKISIEKFEFLNVATPLYETVLNPHLILNTYFDYYRTLSFFDLSPYHYTLRSFSKVQSFLLKSIQEVYCSQGVKISDKHIELIIKQMTKNVEITAANNSELLPHEIISLKKVHYINQSLTLNKKKEGRETEYIKYIPVLSGITKAALSTTSFISAASFQETTRILTEAAIYGKIDWLEGLKENVIVGRLIPAGTGFNAYNDLCFQTTIFPSKNFSNKKLLEIKKTPQKSNYSRLKNSLKQKKLNFRPVSF